MTDLVRVTFTGGPSGDWLSQFHIDRLLGGDVQHSIDIVSDFFVALHNNISSLITIHVNADVTVVDPVSGEPTGIETGTSSTFPGLNGNDPLPWQTQVRIQWHTGTWIGGRQVKGATFVPALCENDNTAAGIPAAGLVTAQANAIAVFTGATTCVPSIYSKTHHNMFPIVAGIPASKWSVLRTRR